MDRDRSVTAHWERIPATTYNLRVIADPSDGRGGYVEITGGTLVSAGTKRFTQGARAVVEARSNTGWRFVRWSGDVSGSSARQTLTMNSNKTATAHWERIPATTYNLRVIADPSDGRGGYVEISGGTLVSAGTKRFNQGARAVVEARSNTGWRFVRWSGDLRGSSARQTLTMSGNKTATAHWERIPATTYNLRVIADPSNGRGGYVEITGGTLVSAGTKRFNLGARAVVEARSNTGWRFVRWSGDVSGSSARQTLTMNGNKTATALFQRATIQRTLTAHVVGNGRVIPSGSTYHDNGSFVGLQAIPDRGYRLRGWSGSVSGTDPWITVHINQDRVAIATFERAPITRYELSVSVSGRGSVSGAGTYDADQTVTLRATADHGYRFVRWRGDAIGSSISATIRMNAHKVVEALFERDDSTSLGSSDQIELRSEQPFSGLAIGDIITLRAIVTRPNGGRVSDATPVELTSQDQGVLMSLERTSLSTRNGEVSARFVVVRLGRVVLLTQAAGDVLVSTVNVGGQSRFQVRVTASPANGGQVSGAGSYQSGRQIALRATPNEGFRFVRWAGDASGTRSSLTLRVTAAATVRAVFERSSYTLTVEANPQGARLAMSRSKAAPSSVRDRSDSQVANEPR